MKKVLVGAVRSKGSFKENGRNIKYDNVKLYLANYREAKCKGFSFDKNLEPVKIKTSDFADVAGISVKEFLSKFEKEYMFHRCRVIGEENDYGRIEVVEVKFSQENCFVLNKKLEQQRKDAEEDVCDEDDEDDYDEEYEDEEDSEDDEEDDEFDISQINTSTGEFIEKKVKK